MRKTAGYGLEVIGLGGVAYAGYCLAAPLGYFLAGLLLVLVGVVMGAKP